MSMAAGIAQTTMISMNSSSVKSVLPRYPKTKGISTKMKLTKLGMNLHKQFRKSNNLNLNQTLNPKRTIITSKRNTMSKTGDTEITTMSRTTTSSLINLMTDTRGICSLPNQATT